jgi:hypothetical protein
MGYDFSGRDRDDFSRSEGKLLKELMNNVDYLMNGIKKNSYELLKMKDVLPKEEQSNLYSILKKLAAYKKELPQVLEQYRKDKKDRDKIRSVLDYMMMDPVKANIKPGYEGKLKKDEKQLEYKIASEIDKKDQIIKFIAEVDEKIRVTLEHYREKKDAQGTAAGKTVALLFIGTFAATVFYALSRVSPENVTVGAFTAGSISPNLFIMLTAVVIFLFFFLTHHKLK